MVVTLFQQSACRGVAFFLVLALLAGCAAEGQNQRAESGALLGALGGAALGGLIGSKSAKAGQGALIGGFVGALTGGLIGNYMDRQAAELKQVAETERTQDGIIVTLNDKILFDVGKSELKPDAQASLGKIAEILKKYPKTEVTVAGFTDNTGPAELNEKLSQSRADGVKFYLVDNGIRSERITARGFGSERPVGDNNTAEGRAKNRRVELHIVPNDDLVAEHQKDQK
jgi:outer membrane protein OmpA-like peptidoglycan-associated protein